MANSLKRPITRYYNVRIFEELTRSIDVMVEVECVNEAEVKGKPWEVESLYDKIVNAAYSAGDWDENIRDQETGYDEVDSNGQPL